MFNFVHASTAAKSFSEIELLDLLEQSREKNARLGITGLLIHEEGSFMQALEGGKEAVVRERYATIRKDARHQMF